MPAIPPELKAWLDLIQWLITGALAVVVWLRKPGHDAGEAVSALRRDVSALMSKVTQRLIVVEEQIKHVPSSSELVELEGTVKAVSAQLAGLNDATVTMRTQLNRIEGYLLNERDSRL